MWKKIDKWNTENRIFSADDVVIAGVSGGADSMCLLCVLDYLKMQIGFDLIVVHVNHGLRGEDANRDEAFVKKVCEERNLIFEAYQVDVKQLAREAHLSEEEAGRNARRNAFEDVMERYHGTKIALAHHKNDNVETFFLNLTRGSKLKGLGGMPAVSGYYIRPLLGMERRQIEAFLDAEGIPYCIDTSNETDAYTRNRIRRHVIPYLEGEINSKTVEHIDQAMEYFREVQEYLEAQMAIIWEKVVSADENGIFVKNEIVKQPALMQKMILRKAITKVAAKEKDISEIHVQSLADLFLKQTGKRVDLPYQVVATRTYDGVAIKCNLEEAPDLSVMELELENGVHQYKEFTITTRVFERDEETGELPKKRFTKWFDYDIISKSVCIRGKMPGDRIVVTKDGHSQKVKQFMVNEKIPREIRDFIPVITEDEQVLWIVGYRQSKAYQVTPQTKRILEIKIDGGNEDGR